MKRIILSLVVCSMLLLVSCQGKQNNDGAGDGSVAEVSRSDTLVWAIPEDSLRRRSAELWEKNVKTLNQLLAEKGYHLAIELRYMSVDESAAKPEDYNNALTEAVKNGEVDIAYCDLPYDVIPGVMSDYLQSGLFYPLTEWLHSPDGAQVYNLYDEDTWKGSSVDGINYILPNESLYVEFTSEISFQRDHVSEQLADSWDGSWSGLWQLMQQIELQEGDCMLMGGPWLFFFEGTTKEKRYEIEDKLVYDLQKGKVQQPFELEEFHDYLSFLHQCFQKGYLTEESGMDSGFWSPQKEKAIEEGKYAIAFGSVGRPDDRQVDTSVVYTGTLGGGTAVSAYSEKKEKALELLRILRTDDDIANALVWGEWDASKILGEDGYVKESYGDDLARDVFGLNDGIFQKEEEGYPSQNMREYRKQCEDSPLKIPSVLLGFWSDYSGMEQELEVYKEVLERYINCWQEEDFEGAYQEANRKVSDVSKTLLKKLNRQIKDWKENEG